MLQGQTDGLAVFRSCVEELLICAPGKMDDDQSFPTGFLILREILIPKEGFELTSGPIPVDKLRPIFDFSASPGHCQICRLVLARRFSAQTWLEGCVPD